MKPVRTAASNFVYLGPTPDIGDAWVERHPTTRAVYLDWKPSDEERRAIDDGALIRLGIFGVEPIPPVSLNVSDYDELGETAAAWRDRAREVLRPIAAGPWAIPPGYWVISADVWEGLQRDGALDPSDGGVPALWGRPLMVVDEEPDRMTYASQASSS